MAQFIDMGIDNVKNTFKNLPNIGSNGIVDGPNARPLNYNLIELKIKAGALADNINPIVKIKAGTFDKTYSVNRNIKNPGNSFNNLVKGSLANLTDVDLQNLYNLEGSTTPGIKFLYNATTDAATADAMWTTTKDSSFNVPEWQAQSIIAIIPIKATPIDLPNIVDEFEIEVGTFNGPSTGTAPVTPTTPATNNGVSVGKDSGTVNEGPFIPIEFAIGGTKVITTTTTCTDGEGKITTHVSEKRVKVSGQCLFPMNQV